MGFEENSGYMKKDNRDTKKLSHMYVYGKPAAEPG